MDERSSVSAWFVPIDGPLLDALDLAPDLSVLATGSDLPSLGPYALQPFPPTQYGADLNDLSPSFASWELDAEAVLEALFRLVLVAGAARLSCHAKDTAERRLDVVRLPQNSAIFDVCEGATTSVFEASDAVFTGNSRAWDTFFEQHPEARALVALRPAPREPGTLRAVVRFALLRPTTPAPDRGPLRVEADRIADSTLAIRRHPSAAFPIADWVWGGHFVWGYTLLTLGFDATKEDAARWFEGTLRRGPRAGKVADHETDALVWEIGSDAPEAALFVALIEPRCSFAFQWEWWAIARALEAPFELLSWLVTESDMGGLDAWGRDRESLRDYLALDAGPERRAALKASYRARTQVVVLSVSDEHAAFPEVAEVLRAVLPALGGHAEERPTLAHLRQLTRTRARKSFPRRVEIELPARFSKDGYLGTPGLELLRALDDASYRSVSFSIRWK